MSYVRYYQFRDRDDAGIKLAQALKPYIDKSTVALGIPRGGIPIAIQIAKKYHIPLDLVITRKIPIHGNPEAGYGAVAEDNTMFINKPLAYELGINSQQIEGQAQEISAEISRRNQMYRGTNPRTPLENKKVILTDDGLASGYTMLAAIKSVQLRGASKIIAAVPVASESSFNMIQPQCDDLIALQVSSHHPFAVASFYQHWHDLSDDEVLQYIQM